MGALRPAEDIRFWQLFLAGELPFQRIPDVEKALASCHSEDEAIQALLNSCNLTPGELNRVKSVDMTQLNEFRHSGGSILTSDRFPESVSSALPHLQALWTLGDPEILSQPRVGIVGTRQVTSYGAAAAQKFGERLACAGVTVVSGGAFGIDAAAHEGALKSGKTVSILPSGLASLYPAGNRALFARIAKSGCLLSQFAHRAQVRKDTFLIRNSTIAAFSDALLIIEAPSPSGALNTASQAAEMGRPVYVVPGPITHNTFRGSHELIRSGATLVDHPDQILEDLHIMSASESKSETPLSPTQSAICAHLGATPVSPEKLSELTGLTASELSTELTYLELDGLIMRGPGGILLSP